MSEPAISLALGSGGARGLAHILVLEALDELGLKPVAIAGASIGAILGAPYAAGMSGAAMRRHVLGLMKDRARLMAMLIDARVGRITDMFSGFGNPLLVDSERLLERTWPDLVPKTFEELSIPLIVSATDYFGRSEAVFSEGQLRPAVAASMAIPGLVKPVRIGERTLIDGGAVNPLPFEHLLGDGACVIAVDVAGGPVPNPTRPPSTFDLSIGTIQIMQSAIVAAKLRHRSPRIVLTPAVLPYRALDFFEAKAIFAAAEPVKDELKRELDAALSGVPRKTA